MSAMAGRTGSRRELRRRALGEKLLEAAEALLADGTPYTEVSVEDLISGAGVSRSTFYKNFEGKADLLALWLSEIVEGLDTVATAWWSMGADATRDDLAAALAQLQGVYAPHGRVMAAAYDLAPSDEAVGALVAEMVARGAAGMRGHLQRGVDEGWIDPELDVDATAGWLTAMTERGFLQAARLEDDDERRRQADALVDLVWHALYAPARAA